MRETARYVNQYIAAAESKSKLANGSHSSQESTSGEIQSADSSSSMLYLKFQAALTNTDARVSTMASQIDTNLGSLKSYSQSIDDRLVLLEKQLPDLLAQQGALKRQQDEIHELNMKQQEQLQQALMRQLSPREHNSYHAPPSRQLNDRLKNIEEMLSRLAETQKRQQQQQQVMMMVNLRVHFTSFQDFFI